MVEEQPGPTAGHGAPRDAESAARRPARDRRAVVGVALYGLAVLVGALTAPGATLAGVLAAVLPYVLALAALGLVGVGFVAWGLYRLAAAADLESVDSDRVRAPTGRARQYF